MDQVRSFRRKQALKQVQSTVGTRKGRGSRALSLTPGDSHAAHELMAPDASPNLRVWQMFDEAAVFDHKLEGARELLTEFESATDEFLLKLEPILRAPLPRVWDAVEGGLAEPTRATISHRHAHTVGGDASVAGLEEARGEFHNRLRGHIARPLEQWSEGLAAVEERLPELVKLRGRVVKSSRGLARYNAKYQRHMAKEGGAAGSATAAAAATPGQTGSIHTRPTGGGMRGIFGACMHPRADHGSGHRSSMPRRHRDDGSSSSDDDVSEVDSEVARQVASEEAGMKLNYKHRKLDAARGDFAELEQLVAGQLAGLARDASWLKSYLVASLLLGKEAMQTSVVALGTTKQPLPGFTGRAAAPREHGEMGYNVDLAAAMPPALANVSTGAGAFGLQLLPNIADVGLAAHKATASPLELSAVPTAQPMQPVTPVPESAAGIRLSDVADTAAVREYEAAAAAGPGGVVAQQGVSGTAGGIAAAVGPVAAGAGREELQQQQQQGEPHMRYDSGMHTGRMTGATALGGREEYDTRDAQRDSSSSRGVVGALKDAAGSVAEAVGLGGSSTHKGVTHREDYSDVDIAGGRDQGVSSGRGITAGYAAESAQPVLRQGLGEEMVCGRKEFTEVEDRPIVKERVTRVLEHHPVQKEFLTQVKYTGETALPSGGREMLGAPETRVVETTAPGPKCPAGMVGHGQPGIAAM
ncbi:hypothetical protein OEZ85_005865 [Tetradesmus obliquus]|uniref:BAR domain-containing protein n=1 Tax=Tetradesmus obliquus TaxID=3088 RepID=A0ABY8UFF1_TETOB|nr:hypothetical protein OEZ85_005865 [Tetradesmus obliquus]